MSKSKNRNNKKGPNYKLAPEQFFALNKEFYENYMKGYFPAKISDLADKLSNTNDYYQYIKMKKFKVGKLEFNNCFDNTDDIANYAKIELMDSYYHGLESFLRIFIAHATLKNCPWLEMCGLTTKRYRVAVEKLANNDFDWLNEEYTGDITVLYVLTGYNEIPESITVEDLKGLRYWISWSANELLNHNEHNSYKHGLALFPRQQNMKILNGEKTLFSFSGDTIETIQPEEKSDRFVWTKSSKYIKCDVYATILHVIANLINSVINIGKYHYINAEHKIDWLPNEKINPMMILEGNDLSEEIGVSGLKGIVHGPKQELLYYK